MPERLKQTYTTDAVGNIRAIERAVGTDQFVATYSYQEPQSFLTEGRGPWGNLAWSYDRIGNRLSELPPTREGDDDDPPPVEVFRYAYEANPAGGNSPKLASIEPAPGGEPGSHLDYSYDAAGDQTAVVTVGAECSGRTSYLDYSAEQRLARLHTSDGPGTTELTYDGRGFLARLRLTFTESSDFIATDPVYSSAGLLMARRFHQQQTPPGDGDGAPAIEPVTQHTTSLFYFAGRPVAQLRRHEIGAGDDELLFLTTDHLGVPLLATDKAGDAVWQGGLDPFGTPFVFSAPKPPGDDTPPPPPPGGETPRACEPEAPAALASLESLGLFLRFPGQWDDPSFYAHGLHGGLYYNVHRWYGASNGAYTQPDPLGLRGGLQLYGYAERRPLVLSDPFGLCACDDDCPSGQWDYAGASVYWGFIGGIGGGTGTFSCRGKPDTQVPVKYVCGLVGAFLGSGVGVDFSFAIAPGGCGCSSKDLLGDNYGVTVANPWISPSFGSCQTPGGPSYWSTANGGKSLGGGVYWMACRVMPR